MNNRARIIKLAGLRVVLAAVFVLAAAEVANAQVEPAYKVSGFTAYEEFRASEQNAGQFLIFDSSIGYDFNQHIGVDVGAPFYFVHDTMPGFSHQWNNNVGDPYLDLRLGFTNHVLNYATVFTFTVPVNETGAFSTGRVGLDWFNHLDHTFGGWITPYANAGVANGILDTRFLSQPYRLTDSFHTLGFIADTEGGMTFRIAGPLSVGGSYYAFLPEGDQKAYAGISNFFLQPAPAETVSQITNDHGYTAYLRLTTKRNFFFEGAYVHSLELNTDAGTLTVGVDLRSIFSRSVLQPHF